MLSPETQDLAKRLLDYEVAECNPEDSAIGPALTLRLLQDVAPPLEIAASSVAPMPFAGILQEVRELNNVSERLESLAGRHPSVEDALLSISGGVRNTATALEVLTLIRNSNGSPITTQKDESKLFLM